MKSIFRISSFVLIIFSIHSCKKDTLVLPDLTTNEVSVIDQYTAISGGSILNDGGDSVLSRGVCWHTKHIPTIIDSKTLDGPGAGSFVSTMTELLPNTQYLVRAYATTSSGTGYGESITFNTLPPGVPILTTDVSLIGQTSAYLGGKIISDGGSFITMRGVYWSASPDPTVADNVILETLNIRSFEFSIAGLTPGITYYIRAFATNSLGTGYGTVISFTTQTGEVLFNPDLIYGIVTDIEGNDYKIISIGTQVWMAENLKSTKYNDGTPIPFISDDTTGSYLITPAYFWYVNNEAIYKNICGAFYNWFAVSTGKLCPVGWHVPTDEEWQIMADYLGGSSIAGSKMKEKGTANWLSSNIDATNESGFTALPCGLRGNFGGQFGGLGLLGEWWSNTELDPDPYNSTWCRWILSDSSPLNRSGFSKRDGVNVRCIKD
jgi:uncharacterized protein (TIGR02145 family)